MKIISDLTPRPDFLSVTLDEQQLTNPNMTVIPDENMVTDAPLYLTVSLAIIYVLIFLFSSSLILRKRNL
jgi:hypothetical protein